MDNADIGSLHWLMDMVESVDVGIVVVDKDYNVNVWNVFMQNHSGSMSGEVINKNLFDVCPDISRPWMETKLESVWLLNSRAFTIWEQRPYLFRFNNYRPITGAAEFMYQNVTFVPLASSDGSIDHVCMIIYDVTDTAVNKSGLVVANYQLEQLSRTDQLTGLNNRGYWEECLDSEFLRLRRSGYNCSLMMFDIDHFKQVNDTHGHPAGDEVIRITAAILKDTIRVTDIPGRYGGEEFVVILLDSNAEDAMILAERYRKIIGSCPVYHDDVKINYTISIGIAEFSKDMKNYSDWIEAADKALYVGKESGRNKSIIFKPDTNAE